MFPKEKAREFADAFVGVVAAEMLLLYQAALIIDMVAVRIKVLRIDVALRVPASKFPYEGDNKSQRQEHK